MKHAVRLVSLLALAASTSTLAVPIQWTSGAGGNGHWYEVIFDRSKGWNAASADAVSRGGYLVTVTSAAEWAFIRDTLFAPYKINETFTSNQYHGSYWLGLQDATPLVNDDDANYAWVTGEAYTFNNFLAGSNQPDDNDSFAANDAGLGAGARENYVQMVWRTYNDTRWIGGWNDVAEPGYSFTTEGLGHLNRRGYIVEWDRLPTRVPEPGSLMVAGAALLAAGFARLVRRRRRS
jgi:hypothetical protein